MHDLWRRCCASVFSITFENAEGRITSGTGFKVGDCLVTNNHVIQAPSAKRVVLRSVRQDGHTSAFELNFGHLEFRTALVDGEPEAGWDYAVLRIQNAAFEAAPSLQLSTVDQIDIGQQVALFGYQFEQPNLSMHLGYVSSQYHKAGVHYLQLDSSVNHGNSGGPLIDVASSSVLGIVTRKATGLTQQFEQLTLAIRQSIEVLQASQRSGARGIIAGVDPVAATIAVETQIERISREISRSANVGIGYAYHIKKIRESLERIA